ncbi:MAG: hypothetical protein C0624_04530 [Desulfuromonas sp.]|nr:MAG: hypothetical protein C0624_04530 [Desulfuromonas sp.]
MDAIIEFFQNFQTERVMEVINDMNIADLVQDPYFLGGAAALAILSLIMKWRGLLALDVGVVGLCLLFSYTVDRGTEVTELYSESLLIFIGGGVVIVAAIIYLVFMKSD